MINRGLNVVRNPRKALRHGLRLLTEPHRLRAYFFYKTHPRHPLFTPAATEFLRNHLRPNMRVFEWGAGRSTLFFAKQKVQLVTIEHDPDWHQKITQLLAIRGGTQVDMQLIEPQSLASNSTMPFLEQPTYAAYVQAIDQYPPNYFDVVVVDGRERAACLVHALAKVKKGGLVILDDSQRERYIPAMNELEQLRWQPTHFSYGFNRTSLWRKP